MTTATPPPSRAPEPPKRRWRRLVAALLALVVLLVIGAAAAPTLLSTSPGKRLLVALVDRQVEGTLAIDDVSLSWLGGQSLRGLTWRDAARGDTVTVGELETEATLWGLLWGDRNLGHTTVRDLVADLTAGEPAAAPPAQPSAEPPPEQSAEATSEPLRLPATLAVDGVLERATVTVRRPGAEPVVIDQLHGEISVPSLTDPVTFRFNGSSRQGKLSGALHGAGELRDAFDSSGALQAARARAQLEVTTTDLPSEAVDAMLGLDGRLVAAVGEKIDLDVKASGTADVQDLRIELRAPRLTSQWVGQVRDGVFALTEPASVATTLTPELFAALAIAPELRLAKGVPAELTIARFTCPLKGFAPSAIELGARLETHGALVLTGDGLPEAVELQSLLAAVETKRPDGSTTFELGADLAQGEQPGQIRCKGVLRDLWNQQGALQTDRLRLDATAEIHGVSTALLGGLAGEGDLIAEALGPRLDLTATARSSGERSAAVVLALRSPRWSADAELADTGGRLALTKPAVLRGTLSRALVERLGLAAPGVALLDDVGATLTIDHLAAPRPAAGQPVLPPADTVVAARLQLGTVPLGGVPGLGDVTISDLELKLGGASLATPAVNGSLRLAQPGGAGLVPELAGATSVAVSLDATTSLDAALRLGAAQLQLGIDSPRLICKSSVQLDAGLARAELTEPAALRLVVTPDLLRQLGYASESRPVLGGPVPVSVTIQRAQLPVAKFALAAVTAAAEVSLPEVPLRGAEKGQNATLRNTVASLAFDGSAGTLDLTLASAAQLEGQGTTAPLGVEAGFSKLVREGRFEPAEAAVTGDVRLDGVPTPVLEALAGGQSWSALIGPTVSFGAKAQLALADHAGVVKANVRSQQLTADLALRLTDTLELTEPATAQLRLTPGGFAQLMRGASGEAPAWELRDDATVDVVVRSWHGPVPWGEAPARALPLDAELSAPALRLWPVHGDKAVHVDHLTGTAKATDLRDSVEVHVGARVNDGSPATAPERDNTTASVTLSHPLGPGDRSAHAEVRLDAWRAAALDQWLDFGGFLAAALGPELTLGSTATLTGLDGPLELDLNATHLRGRVEGALRKGVFAPAKTSVIELDVTEQLGRTLLSRLHPFLRGISKSKPIQLVIPAQGVRIPVADFDLRKVVIPTATLDPGVTTIENDVLLQQLLRFAKRPGRTEMSAWFTPVVCELSGGTLAMTRRVDILLDGSFHVATWGRTDLLKGTFDQTVAIPEPTLAKVFKLEHIGKDELFRIPIRGTADRPQLDLESAALDMGRLQAQDKTLSKLNDQLKDLPALARVLLQQQVDAATRELARALTGRNQGPPPPPGVSPLPWEKAEKR